MLDALRQACAALSDDDWDDIVSGMRHRDFDTCGSVNEARESEDTCVRVERMLTALRAWFQNEVV